MGAWARSLDSGERLRLAGIGATVLVLHVAGWGLFLAYSGPYPALAGLGTLAYVLGVRHAFDPDHIAAIDNTTRKLLHQGKPAHGVGFFFALGHATLVFMLAAVLVVAAQTAYSQLPTVQSYGSYVGVGVSGVFLWVIGILNLIILRDVIGIFRQMKQGAYDREQLEQRLLDRGFANRFFLRSLFRLIDKSWHMFPLGFVFGLGFGTATETGLLAVAAGAAGEVPVIAVLSLPIIFAAGMTALDTLDGVFMTRAYGWAFSNPVRKIYYNITITALTVAVALAVGSVELLHVLATRLQLTSGVWGWLDAIDFQVAGYAIVGIFVLTWGASVLVWKTSRIEERFGAFLERTS